MSQAVIAKSPKIDEFVSALGLSIKNLRYFSIVASAGDIVKIEAIYNLHDDVLEGFYDVVKKYKLVEIEEGAK